MFRGWVELFDRFIESATQEYDDRETGIFEIARHACGMVLVLLVVIIVVCFQAVMSNFDYTNLKHDYTELNLAYLKNGDVFMQVNDRLGALEHLAVKLRTENGKLNDKVEDLYSDNVKLNRLLFICENPNWKPPVELNKK